MSCRRLLPSYPRRWRPAVALLGLTVVAATASCHSEPPSATADKAEQTALLDLQPRKSSFRDIGKRGDSNLVAPREGR